MLSLFEALRNFIPDPFFTLTITQFIFYFSLLEDVAAIAALWSCFASKSKMPRDLKVIKCYIILILVFAALRVILAYTIRNNLLVLTCWSHIQYFLLLYFFHQQFSSRTMFYLLVFLYAGFNVINTAYLEPITMYQKNPMIFSGFVFIPSCIYLFHHLLVKMPVENILNHYIFWINSAILIYFSGVFFVFALDQFFYVQHNFIIHTIVAVAKNLLLAKAFLVNAKHNNQPLLMNGSFA